MVELIKGSKGQITIRMYAAANGFIGDPIDLSGATEIVACFQKEDSTDFEAKLSTGKITVLGSPLLGKIQIQLAAADTLPLAAVEHETLQVKLYYGVGADPVSLLIKDAYSVLESKC